LTATANKTLDFFGWIALSALVPVFHLPQHGEKWLEYLTSL
jgi:hypothetical protein